MSFTITVPAAVPSVFQGSKPLTPSSTARSLISEATLDPPPPPVALFDPLSPSPPDPQALSVNSKAVTQEIRRELNRDEETKTVCFFINFLLALKKCLRTFWALSV
jgi:hypothetical protein